MDQRWTQIRKLFREALELEPAQWEAFLEAKCPDAKMREKVLAMLSAYDDEDTFLERPAAGVGPAARDTTTGLVGTRVGPYEIRRSIARGGMGVVFEALDTKLDKVVALKMMSPALVQDPTFRGRFEQEAKTLARLEDPHFVRVNALIDDGPNTFIVMEYVDGITLAQHIRNKGPLAGKDTIAVGLQLLQALSKAHRQGIVHRDLKPSNIMLTKNYEGRLLVKVLDFGIAKNLQPDGSQTRTIGAVGTLFYMSPEQARGLRSIDYRTDLYSLGVTLYEAVSGELPFDVGMDEYTVRRQIVEGHVIPVEKRKPDTAPALARVIAKALSTDPEDRYANAEAMREGLVEALEEMRAQQALPPKPPPRPTVASGAKKPFSLLAGAGGVVLVVAALLFVYNTFLTAPGTPTGQSLAVTEAESLQVQATASMDSAGNAPERPVIDQIRVPASGDTATSVLTENLPAPQEAAPETPTGADEPAQDDPAGGEAQANPVSPEQQHLQDDGEGGAAGEGEAGQEAPALDAPGRDSTQQPLSSPVQTGMLSVMMSPSGSVFVDEELMARDILVYTDTLEAGGRRIRVEHPALGRWVCTVPIVADEKREQLIDFEASVAVIVAAEDADTKRPILDEPVFVEGQQTLQTTPGRIMLPAGLRQISLQMDNYEQVDIAIDSNGCFQKVGSLVNIDPQSMRGGSPPRVLVRMRKSQ